MYIISERGLHQMRCDIPQRLHVTFERAASVDDRQKVTLGNTLTCPDPCYPLQHPHGPSGLSCNNPFENKDIALYSYFSMALFVSYSYIPCQF